MIGGMEFALNHSILPGQRFAALAALASRLGLAHVEIRTDLPGVELADGTPPETVRRQAAEAGLHIATVNALQRFDDWTDTRAQEAAALARTAQAAGVAALVLCPVNDTQDRRSCANRAADLRQALSALMPILSAHGLAGLVEPLGFPQSTLRTKRAALDAIDSVGGDAIFRLVHDTFHHFLAGEAELFSDRTGLIHVSGVEEHDLPTSAITDAHRVLVTRSDRLGTCDQLRALAGGGYRGLVSMEPFAASVSAHPDLIGTLHSSFALLRTAVSG
jgi:2-keto-myo-inositol isomerase